MNCGEFCETYDVDGDSEQLITFSADSGDLLQITVMLTQESSPQIEAIAKNGSWNVAINDDPEKYSFGVVDDQWTFVVA